MSAFALFWALGTQHASAQTDAGVMSDTAAGDIIVTARRRNESLQDVPQTVNAVTGAEVEKLNLTKFEDIESLVPGLTLEGGNDGFTTTASIRGVGYDSTTGAPPTVEFYLNDALTFPVFLFQSMYDVGQIEVLRGPQGTLRGRASPSGSITVTTRKADLQEVGGYATMTGTDQGMINVNGAIGVPIIKDMLAIRVAGIIDENEVNRVRSINVGTQPYSRTQGGRVSLRFEPSSELTANIMYSRLHREVASFIQAESISLSQPGAPVGTGPIIRAKDRRGIVEGATKIDETQQILNGNIGWTIGNQQLNYVGSYTKWNAESSGPLDFANVFPNREYFQLVPIRSKQQTHELRLSSVKPLFDFLDYTVGAFYSDLKSSNPVTQPTAITIPGTTSPTLLALSPLQIANTSHQKETSFFGNLTAHFGPNTELSAGLRHIIFDDEALMTIPAFGVTLADIDETYHPTVYNVSLKHSFSRDFMIYANTGSGWRKGPNATGMSRSLTPRLRRFTQLRPETSKSYEVGVKAALFDRKLDLSVAAFHQDFKNFFYANPSQTSYINLVGGVETPGNFDFLANVPVKVNGIDFQANFRPSRRFSANLLFSYAKGKIKNGEIACNDLNGDGIADPGIPTLDQIRASAGTSEAVAVCRTNDRISNSPNWNSTLQLDYTLPVSNSADGFVRGLFNYYPRNRNQPSNPYDTVSSYGLLNVYLGLRDPDGAWEVSLFGKNITNTFRTLSRSDRPLSTNAQEFGATGLTGVSYQSNYVAVTTTAPREFGINIRYAFGAR
ncbi:TonB-dependent receptor [Sphingobium tyrosinilyticum]|uniref:TonB-dependent receptor n=1 Tax=Sphingobium tyrosinilyticum TaxID=2715436 RepID=A0ABV9F4M9_9SPHN